MAFKHFKPGVWDVSLIISFILYFVIYRTVNKVGKHFEAKRLCSAVLLLVSQGFTVFSKRHFHIDTYFFLFSRYLIDILLSRPLLKNVTHLNDPMVSLSTPLFINCSPQTSPSAKPSAFLFSYKNHAQAVHNLQAMVSNFQS